MSDLLGIQNGGIMSQKQWNHGFHKGKEKGFWGGFYENEAINIEELKWAAHNLTSMIADRIYSESDEEFEGARFLIVCLDAVYSKALKASVDLKKDRAAAA